MVTLVGNTSLNRGTTIYFSTTFYDENGEVTQPVAAFVSIACLDLNGNPLTVAPIAMTPPVIGSISWTANWDTRSIGTGNVYYSIHTQGFPAAVEDGRFILSGNLANLPMFS